MTSAPERIARSRFRAVGTASFACLMTAAAGCARLGYTDRVLHRVASPDGRIVAICQEVPIFDGPEFDLRLERADGSLLRGLLHMGDGGGCNEMIWSGDGRTLAVLTSHVAGITLIDVEWALSHPQERNSQWFARGVGFSREDEFNLATQLVFVLPGELEFQLCEYSLDETRRRGGEVLCSQPARPQRLRIPFPLVAGRPT